MNEQTISKNLEGLDEDQLYAVTRRDGKYLVLAGSGSGKSRVLTHRVAYLIEKKVNPWEIVSISFTNKASNELSERIVKLVGEKGLEVNMGTFHSLCTRILLRNQGALNMENMTIISEDDSKKIVAEIAEAHGFLKDSIREVQNFINYCGNHGIYPEDYERLEFQSRFPRDFLNIHEEYTRFKQRVGYVDFDDLLGLTHKLFKLRPDILKVYAGQYKYIMVNFVGRLM